jgi:hypothetical protein
MTITELIKDLQEILNTKGDLKIGCSDTSPDEGFAYPVCSVELMEAEDDELIESYIEIRVDQDEDDRLNKYYFEGHGIEG